MLVRLFSIYWVLVSADFLSSLKVDSFCHCFQAPIYFLHLASAFGILHIGSFDSIQPVTIFYNQSISYRSFSLFSFFFFFFLRLRAASQSISCTVHLAPAKCLDLLLIWQTDEQIYLHKFHSYNPYTSIIEFLCISNL